MVIPALRFVYLFVSLANNVTVRQNMELYALLVTPALVVMQIVTAVVMALVMLPVMALVMVVAMVLIRVSLM